MNQDQDRVRLPIDYGVTRSRRRWRDWALILIIGWVLAAMIFSALDLASSHRRQ